MTIIYKSFEKCPQFGFVRAKFNPKITDDLSDISPPVGTIELWQKNFFIDDEVNKTYSGQWAWHLIKGPKFYGWVPTEDLEIINDD